MTMVNFIAGASISTAVFASGYKAPSMMSVHCDEIGDRLGIEAEALLRNHGDEAGAGFEIGIVKLRLLWSCSKCSASAGVRNALS